MVVGRHGGGPEYLVERSLQTKAIKRNEVKHEEDALEVHLEVEEGDEMQLEAEGIYEEHSSSPIITMAGALESPPLVVGYALTASKVQSPLPDLAIMFD